MKTLTTLSAVWMAAAVAAPAEEMQPLMVRPGALLLEDSFDGGLDPNRWAVAIGEWKSGNGALAGTERPADHHAAVIKAPFTSRAAVIRFSFQLVGDSTLHLSINDPAGHNCRVCLSRNSVVLRKDADKNDPRSYAAVLDEAGAALAPDTWHTVTVELNGAELLARLDDGLFVYGSHPGIDKDKKDFGFPVMGAALFDNVKVWSGTPDPGWPAQKAKLLARAATRPAVDRSRDPADAYRVAEVKARDRLSQSDAKFRALVDARAAIQTSITQAFPVVNRRGPKAEAEKQRLAAADAGYQRLTADLRAAQKNERDYLFAQAPEVKQAWEAFSAANRSKVSGKAKGKAKAKASGTQP